MTEDCISTPQAVQNGLLPGRQLTFGDLCCETYYRPFHDIGGDYYDFVRLDRCRVGLAIGDVSGKGVGAALIMASLQASLRARLLNEDTRPSTLIGTLNQLVYQSSLPHIYATLFYGEYHAGTQVLTYVNAGHNPALILRRERDQVRLIRLESEGPPVGLFRDTVYKECVCPLQLGDVLVAYTDGITESSNEVQEVWGDAGLEAILSTCIGKRPAEIIEAIVAARDRFAGPTASTDDTTLVVTSIERCSIMTMASVEMKNTHHGEAATLCPDAVQAGRKQMTEILELK